MGEPEGERRSPREIMRVTDHHHTVWSDPKSQRLRLRELPGEPAALPDALERFVIHRAVAASRGLALPPGAEEDADLRRVEALLHAAVLRDPRNLTEARSVSDHLYCTCHDFALIATSALREQGIAARLRVGFASYFPTGMWEDHWVCEYQSGGRWAILDAQLGTAMR